MSDPAKTPEEIEDVLASIRRLVSDHTPGPDGSMRPAEKAPETGVEPEATSDRLVLTASLRVQEPDDPWSPVAGSDQATAEGETYPADGVVEAATPEDEPVAQDETDALVFDVISQTETDMAPLSGDHDWQPDDRMKDYDTVGPVEDTAEPLVAEDNNEPGASDPETETETDASEPLSETVELASTDLSETDFESETGDENWPNDGAEAALLTLVARREPAMQTSEVETSEEEHEEEPVAEQPAPDSSGSEGPVEGRGHPDAAESHFEPGNETRDDPPITPIFSRRMTQTEDTAEVEQQEVEAEDLGEDPSPFTFPDADEGILDEDTLREIIVDVVRQELQGVLGQRITRNVRKMVRREIRLALAAEDLD